MDNLNPKDAAAQSKVPMSLVPPVAVAHAAAALENGARKYGKYNWRSADVRASVYLDACHRHLGKYADGEDIDGDSGAHHLGHAIAGLCIVLDALAAGTLVDDRPTSTGFKTGLVMDMIQQSIAESRGGDDN